MPETQHTMTTYLFHRTHEGRPFFYPVDLMDDADAIENAKCNPGTDKVTRISGELVWRAAATGAGHA